MEPIHENENLAVLCKHIHDYSDMIDANKLSSVLLSLIYLNVSFDNPLMSKLLIRLQNETHLLTLSSLMTFSHIVKALQGLQSKLTQKIMKSMKLIIESNDSPTVYDVYCVASIANNFTKLITDDTIRNIIQWISKSKHSLNFNDNLEYLQIILRFISISHLNQSHIDLDLIDIMTQACIQNEHLFDSMSMYDCIRALKSLNAYKGVFPEMMDKKAEEMLNNNLRISELANLMMTLLPSTSKHLITKFENVLISKLSDPEVMVDALAISNIADSLMDMKIVNKDVLRLFQKHVISKSENIISFISRFSKVSNLLIRYPFDDPEDDITFNQETIKYLEGTHGMSLVGMISLGTHILTLEDVSQIPQHTLDRLISSLHRWSFSSLTRLLCGLERRITNCHLNRQHFIELSQRVQQIIISKLADSPENVILFGKSAAKFDSKILNPSLNRIVINSLEHMSKDLNVIQLQKMLKFLFLDNRHNPIMFENIVNYIIDNPVSSYPLTAIRICAKANYTPKRMPELIDIVKTNYKQIFKDGYYTHCLNILLCLSQFQCFPKEELSEFFSLEVMQSLEDRLERTQDRNIEHNLMSLNRAVVLECPELNIPWFHEHMTDHFDKNKFTRNKKCLDEQVYNTLVDIFGGSEYINRNAISPYYHTIDFECTLDEFNKPISVSELNSNTFTSIQRLAVCTQDEQFFCKDSKIITGYEQMRKRQLGLLNYKVIEVPFFEWYSMGMTERTSKINYLKDKIGNQ